MELLSQLWLPILVLAALVFVASFVSWMVLPLHKKEWAQMPDEGDFFVKLGALGLEPGKYMFPAYGDRETAKSPEFLAKWEAGPHGVIQIWGRRPNFVRNLALTFVFYLVTAYFVAYLTWNAVGVGPDVTYGHVFRIAGVAAILAYLFAAIPNAIWFQKPLAGLFADLVDGVVFGLLTAGAFAGFWPAG